MRAPVDIPVFKLYGEAKAWPTPDLIHCELIAERSRLHDWEIGTHAHSDLVQVLYVQNGQAVVDVDGVVTTHTEAVLQVIPTLCVHGFRFSECVQGYVLTIASPLVDHLAAALENPPLSRAACFRVANENRNLDTLFDSLASEYHGHAFGRDLMLHSLITTLLVWIGRQSLENDQLISAMSDRGREHLRRFLKLTDQNYRKHLPTDWYAMELGLSVAHLNALCRRLADQSALHLIHQRLLLEAKRNLVYTALSINQIADGLGFTEAAYFSRFFKRYTGVSPKEFRSQR